MERKLLLQQENKIVYIRYGVGSVKALKGSLSPDSNFTRLNENPALLGNLPFDSKVFVKGKNQVSWNNTLKLKPSCKKQFHNLNAFSPTLFVFLRTNQDISKAMGWPKLGLWIFGRIFCACHSRLSSFDLRMKNVINQSKTCSAIPKPLNSLNYRLFNRFLFLRDDAVRREIYPEILSARSIPIHSHIPLEGSKETHFSFKQLSSSHAAARGEKNWRIHIRNVEKLSAEL